MSSKPSTYRKASGSFVVDPSAMNLIQISPRTNAFHHERSPFTMASHSSKTNFIGDTVISEGPRAVAVSGTGEKHSIAYEDDAFKASAVSNTNLTLNTNPFAGGPAHLLTPKVTNQESVTLTNLENNADRARHTSKKSKASRHYVNQKPRPVFTPRNLARLPPRKSTVELCPQPKTHNSSAQTQTDIYTPKPSRVLQSTPPMPPTPPTSVPRKCTRESVGDMLNTSRRQPLRVLSQKKTATMKSYAELRNIASALTLITVVSWLFSFFFELEGLIEVVTGLVRSLTGWFNERKQPMTKAEMLVQHLRDLWPE